MTWGTITDSLRSRRLRHFFIVYIPGFVHMDDKVVIVVGSNDYEVSKAKLTEKSSYFNSMFNGDFLEKNEDKISLKGIDTESWERILYFLQNGKMRIEEYSPQLYKKYLRLLEAAAMLQFTDIQERCMRKIFDSLEAGNALEVLEVASKLDLEVLIQKARAIALWNADTITNSDAFFNLTAEQVEGYLSDPALHCSSGEWGVWEAVDRWINSPPDFKVPRTDFLPRLIKCVSLNKLNASDLKTICLNENVRASALVSAALKVLIEENSTGKEGLKRNGEDKKDNDPVESDLGRPAEEVEEFIKTWRSLPARKLPLVPAVIAKVNVEPGLASPYVVRFSEEEKKLIPVLRLDEVESSLAVLVGFKVIANGSKLYMLGGEVMTRQVSWYHAVWQYDQILGRWNFLANLRKETRHSSACIIGDDLYVLGGFGRHRLIQDSVFKLSLSDRIWTVCAPLPEPMYSVSCCVFKGNIYVIQSRVYHYSPERDRWTTMDITLPPGKVFTNALANDKYIYLTGRSRSVFRFDPSLPSVKLEEVGNFTYECSEACLIEDHIYSLSEEEFDLEIYCEKLDVNTGESIVLWKETAGNEIATLSPNHHHGCFPLLLY